MGECSNRVPPENHSTLVDGYVREHDEEEIDVVIPHHLNPTFVSFYGFPFPLYMKPAEFTKLRVGDKIDHRDSWGRYTLATIQQKKSSAVRVHYDGWDKKWDVWSDYTLDPERFFTAGSVSKLQPHRLTHLTRRQVVRVNPRLFFKRRGEAARWKPAVVLRVIGGEAHVAFVHRSKTRRYWLHLDDESEIAGVVGNLSKTEFAKLRVGDKIVHCDSFGGFYLATIKERKASKVLVHYEGWNKEWDTWSDYTAEPERFYQAHAFPALR
eukprot:CAMPEP_0197047254 /NCGR_PEP_ID=MMETSP1384-20130603/22784_1 /TAXON_ID=29189 /ORGANISM="Ammonia sp." /LENGTH=266 /DNA_ID=CAMNT_0042479149 /DNA_START=32 /DNA_END=832 /DNA_ORIENTATION=-